MNRNAIITITALSALLVIGRAASAADTLTGKLSDAMCGTSHGTMTEHGKKMSDKQCTLACVQHGSQYVFVSGDKVFKIGNQSFKELPRYAGDTVTLTGDVKGDMITVATIEKAR
jgi:hypothetical protein